MANPISLAYSPCPNDTYIFAAWTNGLLEGAMPVRPVLEDVESLNSSALRADYQLTKVSYGAIPQLTARYSILRAGGAMGRGCGPLLVAKPGTGETLDDLSEKIVAIPGEMTTAFMLLRLAMSKRPQTLMMRFDKIMDAVESGVADAGLIIHESRFTYEAHGLVPVIDLGTWWEEQTNLPIPLGAILIRDDFEPGAASEIDDTIRKSLKYAREHEADIISYVREHSTEMDEEVMRKHIGLYVNQFTEDVGDEGIKAVNELFRRAHEAQIMPETAQARFV